MYLICVVNGNVASFGNSKMVKLAVHALRSIYNENIRYIS